MERQGFKLGHKGMTLQTDDKEMELFYPNSIGLQADRRSSKIHDSQIPYLKAFMRVSVLKRN